MVRKGEEEQSAVDERRENGDMREKAAGSGPGRGGEREVGEGTLCQGLGQVLGQGGREEKGGTGSADFISNVENSVAKFRLPIR